jgi:hypothetical protein
MMEALVATIGVIVSGVVVSIAAACELEVRESAPAVPVPDRLLTRGLDSSDGGSFCANQESGRRELVAGVPRLVVK